ncbi:ABC transporter permease subunit [Actinoplanes friuliensis]|uniref:Binding-protein-dependent transport systems inner membrane component n=1 Tax=Actinoplanes friuliensis DSM 7358 TaxID=1246995 RepID=U5W412_9ACTN|nr:ABC transporter permease subunit [Actinoplanes friuliensis]AGZ42720.1 binding-protein-dependent transport systems inner membrane component [Actinoplanes friuliensis DSM 7358]
MTTSDLIRTEAPPQAALPAREQVTLRPSSRRDRRPVVPRPVRRALGPLGVLAIWYALSATGVLPPEVLASPVDVLAKAWDMTLSGELPTAIAVSGERVLYGFAIGASIGTFFALIAGLFRVGEDLVDSTVGMLRTLPWVGLIPLFIIWFGIDEQPKIALVALGVTFPLYFNIYAGIRGVDAQLIEAGNVLGLGRGGLIRHVILPGALPNALVGLRYALGSAWLALVFAEQVNASQGIGYLMTNAEQFFQTDVIVVCLIVYAFLGLFTDLIVRLAIRYLLAWRASFEGS